MFSQGGIFGKLKIIFLFDTEGRAPLSDTSPCELTYETWNEFIRFENEKRRIKSDVPVWPGWPFMPRNDNAIGMISESMNLPPHMMTPGAQTIIWPQKRSKLSCQENSENAP